LLKLQVAEKNINIILHGIKAGFATRRGVAASHPEKFRVRLHAGPRGAFHSMENNPL